MRVDVDDPGGGQTRDTPARVFEAFHQANNSMTRQYGGPGLGLTITKKLCEMVGGTITAISALLGKTVGFLATSALMNSREALLGLA